MLTAKEFKPCENKFYSKGLYQWLKKHPFYNRIYSSPWSFLRGYDPENPVLMIGIKDSQNRFHGNGLRAICSEGGSRQAFAYGLNGHHVEEWKDVTEEFIEEYRRIGKCYIHGDHGHEFIFLSSTHKQCKNCKKEFRRESKRITKHFWEAIN